jgi:uncharacterized protein
MTRTECLRHVEGAPYGRIIFTSGALPAVSPVSFILDGDVLVFDVDPDTALADVCRDAVVAFEVDDVDLAHGDAWSVTMTGRTRPVTADPSEKSLGTSRFLRVGLAPEVIAGHRTTVRPSGTGVSER